MKKLSVLFLTAFLFSNAHVYAITEAEALEIFRTLCDQQSGCKLAATKIAGLLAPEVRNELRAKSKHVNAIVADADREEVRRVLVQDLVAHSKTLSERFRGLVVDRFSLQDEDRYLTANTIPNLDLRAAHYLEIPVVNVQALAALFGVTQPEMAELHVNIDAPITRYDLDFWANNEILNANLKHLSSLSVRVASADIGIDFLTHCAKLQEQSQESSKFPLIQMYINQLVEDVVYMSPPTYVHPVRRDLLPTEGTVTKAEITPEEHEKIQSLKASLSEKHLHVYSLSDLATACRDDEIQEIRLGWHDISAWTVPLLVKHFKDNTILRSKYALILLSLKNICPSTFRRIMKTFPDLGYVSSYPRFLKGGNVYQQHTIDTNFLLKSIMQTRPSRCKAIQAPKHTSMNKAFTLVAALAEEGMDMYFGELGTFTSDVVERTIAEPLYDAIAKEGVEEIANILNMVKRMNFNASNYRLACELILKLPKDMRDHVNFERAFTHLFGKTVTGLNVAMIRAKDKIFKVMQDELARIGEEE